MSSSWPRQKLSFERQARSLFTIRESLRNQNQALINDSSHRQYQFVIEGNRKEYGLADSDNNNIINNNNNNNNNNNKNNNNSSNNNSNSSNDKHNSGASSRENSVGQDAPLAAAEAPPRWAAGQFGQIVSNSSKRDGGGRSSKFSTSGRARSSSDSRTPRQSGNGKVLI